MQWPKVIRTLWPRIQGHGGGTAVWLLAASALGGPVAAEDPEVLPRSIYVPVRFEVASCLHDVVIRTQEGEVRAVAPGRLVSQFTFYDSVARSTPEWERLTVEGWVEGTRGPDGRNRAPERFRAGIVITPASIYIGRKRLDLKLESRMRAFRWRTDLRFPERTLRLRPAGKCDETVTGADNHPQPPAGS